MRGASTDLLANRRAARLYFGLPQLGFVAGFFLPEVARVPLWTLSLAWLGAVCTANALRCGRVHCYLTGPFYLASSLAVAWRLDNAVIPGAYDWLWLGLGIAVAGNLLQVLPERVWGRYRR